jgi:hypothetical protein
MADHSGPLLAVLMMEVSDRKAQTEPADHHPEGRYCQDEVIVSGHLRLRNAMAAATTHAPQPSAPMAVPRVATLLTKVRSDMDGTD